MPLWRRLGPLRASLVATLVLGALLGGDVLGINRGISSTTAGSNLVGTTEQAACLQRYPDPNRLYIVPPLPLFGYPPAQLVLRNCHFQPGEKVRLEGSIFGYDEHGQPLGEKLGPLVAQVTATGILTATLDVPNHTLFEGSYALRLTADGAGGRTASADEKPEGHLAQPTRSAGE